MSDLKRFLFTLPAESDFTFSQTTRQQIRKHIFSSISCNGTYLEWLFPNAFSNMNPHQMLQAVDHDFDNGYSKYYKMRHARDPRFNSHNHHAFHLGTPCARIFRKGEPIYRCLTCGFDDTCALCSHCFQADLHPNHNVHIAICLRDNGGVCDCGDPEAWVQDFSCPYATSSGQKPTLTDCLMPEPFAEAYLETIETLLDYVIDVMTHSDLQFTQSTELTKAFIEFYSNNSQLDSQKYGLDGEEDINSSEYCLLIYNDQNRHYREAVQRIRLASRKVKEFAIMVADRAQVYGKAIVVMLSNLDLLRERQRILGATGLATAIRSKRDVFREDMCDEILLWINELTESEMFKISTPAKNLFCKAFCRRWTKGLKEDPKIHQLLVYNTGYLDFFNHIPKVPTSKSDSDRHAALKHWKFEPKQWNLDSQLCADCEYNLTPADYDTQKSHLGSRFQYLVYMDIRFWRSIRALLHVMYSTSLITNLGYKQIISCQYVDVYPAIADMFLLKDREPELNIMFTLSTQLFTCPSNSTAIVRHGDLARILASIYGFFTDGHIKSPQNVEVTHQISMKSLKNRIWGQPFFDVGYVLSRSLYSDLVPSWQIISMTCDILALFQGKPVLKRENKNHIEFDNSEYSSFFQSILLIYQFADSTARSLKTFASNSEEQSLLVFEESISAVFKFLLTLENNLYPGLADDTIDINLFSSGEDVDIEPIEQNRIQRYSIDTEKVCFLHPIHSFISWLLEASSFKSIEDVKRIFHKVSAEFGSDSIRCSPVVLFEYPIRTIVLMSQIKSGFWVRNGFGVRSQLQLYKNTSLRESGYMRDLFLLQLFSNMYSPNFVCFTFLKRWLLLEGYVPQLDENDIYKDVTPLEKLKDYLTRRQENTTNEIVEEGSSFAYDIKILTYMIEECLNFFIHLLTEDLYLQGLSQTDLSTKRIESEIIQNLCFGHMSYTKLCGLIPDHIVAEKRFDIILDELTVFTPPNSSKDVGSYRLKEEYFSRINPYYFNYSTNTKDDAVRLVKEKIRQLQQCEDSEVVITPKISDLSKLGIYKYIGNFTVSSYFEDFIITNLFFVSLVGIEKSESLLETLLHLLHICSYESNLDIESHGSFFDLFMNGTKHSVYKDVTIAKLLYKIVTDFKLKAHHPKIRAIFDNFSSKYDVHKEMKTLVDDYDEHKTLENKTTEKKESETDRKKRIAKEKQAKLLAKFKKQQNLFLKKNSSAEGEMVDAEMEEFDEVGWSFPEPHCILCQDTAEHAGPFGIISYVSKSSEFRSVPFDDKYWFLKAFSDGCSLDQDEDEKSENVFSPNWHSYMDFVKEDNVIGPGFTSHEHVDNKLVSLSCGHGMHFKCYLNYLNNSRNRQNQITRNTPDRHEHKEFLCPLCKAINNMFVPIVWHNNKRELDYFTNPGPIDNGDLSVFNSLSALQTERSKWVSEFIKSVKLTVEEFSILTPNAKKAIDSSLQGSNPEDDETFKSLLSIMSQTLSLFSFPGTFKTDSSTVLVNTIKSVEIALRGESSNETLVFNQLTNNNLINLRSVSEFRITSLYMKTREYDEGETNQLEAYISLIANLLCFLNQSKFNEKVLEQDFFEMLVNVFPIKDAGFLFNVILKATFLGFITQTVYLVTKNILNHDYYQCPEYSILDVPIISTVDEDRARSALAVFRKVKRSLLSCVDEDMIVNDHKFGYVFYSMLLKACTPFLRRAAIYANVLCADTGELSTHEMEHIFLEADRICHFLKIDNLHTILEKIVRDTACFESERFHGFFESVRETQTQEMVQLEYPGLIKLIDLPDRLDFFFTKYYYSDKYDKPHMVIENPAVCLFCGEVVDVQKCAIGEELGECTVHVLKECPNSVGIFLLPKDKSVLLLHKNGGSFTEAPYLDLHGELPVESKRSNPLHLMKPRYNGLIRNIWLSHNLADHIVRNLDHVIDAGGWDTL